MITSEILIREYVSEFMEKVYYFCLKKTGSPEDALDLAQDISLGIISSLSKGAQPEDFAAYVWRSARNRYADHSENRRKARERDGGDVYELELAGDEKSPEESAVLSEQLSLLRRELAFISEEYRKIVVAFYIDDRSVKDISASLGLPENTVKSKLFRARKILKEGMDMAREFGPKSYKPENISFVASGHVTPQLPWGAVGTMLSKNILIEASDNPSTVEELAVALGIAVPYMREEVDKLVCATLLKAIDGKKYVTDFPIVSAGKRAETVEILKKSAPKAAECADEIAEDVVKKLIDMGCTDNSSLDGSSLKWYAVFAALVEAEADSHLSFEREPRSNGDDWEFYGFEEGGTYADQKFVSYNNNSECDNFFGTFVMHSRDLCVNTNAPNFNLKNVIWAAKLIRSGRNYNDLTDHEKTTFDSLKALFHAEPDGKLVSDILIMSGDEYGALKKAINEHPKYEKLVGIMRKNGEDILELLKSESNPYVKKYLPGVVNIANHIRGFVADEEIKAGRLSLPEDPANSTATVHVILGGEG